jgi:clan AA aspartic protease (TIGR02281 family)
MMQRDGETYVVPVRINGAITLPFTVDSGASDVLIPVDMVLTLARTGTIARDDCIGNQTHTLADGSTIKSVQFVLRELQVGDQVIRNVTASLGPVKSNPLLGRSFLSRFTSWTLDNDRHALVLGRQRPVSDLH